MISMSCSPMFFHIMGRKVGKRWREAEWKRKVKYQKGYVPQLLLLLVPCTQSLPPPSPLNIYFSICARQGRANVVATGMLIGSYAHAITLPIITYALISQTG